MIKIKKLFPIQIGILIATIIIIGFSVFHKTNTMQQNTTPTETTASAIDTKYYFPRAGQAPDKELINIINSSEKTLDIAIYSLTKQNIVNAIAKAQERGVTVRIITDKQESNSKYESKELAYLKKSNISIKINTHSGLMHLKTTIADNKIVTTGSYNYTEAATNKNDEVLVVINNNDIASDWDKEFERMWNDNKNYTNY